MLLTNNFNSKNKYITMYISVTMYVWQTLPAYTHNIKDGIQDIWTLNNE